MKLKESNTADVLSDNVIIFQNTLVQNKYLFDRPTKNMEVKLGERSVRTEFCLSGAVSDTS
jgi:hypothetical protein